MIKYGRLSDNLDIINSHMCIIYMAIIAFIPTLNKSLPNTPWIMNKHPQNLTRHQFLDPADAVRR